MTVPVKVSLLDLTVDQVEQLETEFGKPVDAWIELPSRAAVYRRIYSMVTGADPASVGRMTMRDLTAAVSLGEEEDEDTETANPTPLRPTG